MSIPNFRIWFKSQVQPNALKLDTGILGHKLHRKIGGEFQKFSHPYIDTHIAWIQGFFDHAPSSITLPFAPLYGGAIGGKRKLHDMKNVARQKNVAWQQLFDWQNLFNDFFVYTTLCYVCYTLHVKCCTTRKLLHDTKHVARLDFFFVRHEKCYMKWKMLIRTLFHDTNNVTDTNNIEQQVKRHENCKMSQKCCMARILVRGEWDGRFLTVDTHFVSCHITSENWKIQ